MAKSMTKAQIVDALAKATSLGKKDVAGVLEAQADLAYKQAKTGFTVPGLGKLVVVQRKARKGRNPATGETIRIPAKRVPDAVERFINVYTAERTEGEPFNDFFDRVGVKPFEAAVEDLTITPEFSTDNIQEFVDWEREGLYVLERGEGECAV